MSLINKTDELNLKLSQLKFSIDQNLIVKDFNYDWIFKKLSDIDNEVDVVENFNLQKSRSIDYSALYFALKNENLESFQILLEHGADFTATNENGSTVLHVAIEKIISNYHTSDVQHYEIHVESEFAKVILSAHNSCKNFLNPSNQNGFSHFHIACLLNHVKSVEFFLVNGVNVNRAVEINSPYFPGYTPLHFTANCFALETTETLLKFGADLNLKNAQGFTPLHLLLEKSFKYVEKVSGKKQSTFNEKLVRCNIKKMLTLLVQNMYEAELLNIDAFGISHLHYVSNIEDKQMMKSVLRNMINIDHFVNLDSTLFAGYTALHFAAHFNLRTVRMLMRKGASMEAKEVKGLTPFDFCVKIFDVEEIFKILTVHPVWKNIQFINSKNVGSPFSPVKLADVVLAMSDINRLSALFKNYAIDANIYVPGDSTLWPGFTLLHIAVILSKDSTEQTEQTSQVLNELFKNGADLNCQDSRGRTALNIAFREGKFETVELLLSLCRRCEPLNLVDNEKLSHLHILSYTATFGDSAHKLMLSMLSKVIDIDLSYHGKSIIFGVAPGSTALHVAMKSSRGWDYVPKILLAHGADIMARDSCGLTPIHLTLMRNDEDKDFAEKVLSTSSLKDCVADEFQLSHLHVACYANHEDAVKKLIEQGADVNIAIVYESKNETNPCLRKFIGFTPLRFAVMNDNPQIAMALLVKKANVLAREPNGMTPLYAALKGDTPNISQAFEHKENIFLYTLTRERSWQRKMLAEDGVSILHVAVCCSDVEIITDLLDRGAVNDQVLSRSPIWPGFTAVHVLVSYDEQRHSQHSDLDDEGKPGSIIIMELLLAYNADITLRNSTFDTPLHMISKEWTINADGTICTLGKRAWLCMLLQAHDDFDINPTNAQGLSFFHIACALGEVSIVTSFLEHGQVEVNKPIDHFSKIAPGCTPLHLVLRVKSGERPYMYSQLEIVNLLLENGADVNAEDICGSTPLHDAVISYYSVCDDFVERIIRGGADINKRNVKGETVLELLLKLENVRIEKIKYLLKCGCSINANNPVTGQNLWALALSSTTFEAIGDLIFMSSINLPELLNANEEGRSIIHHIVSINTVSQWEFDDSIRYKQLIKQILEERCDVDDQDKLGRTALHFAAKHFNHHGISVLLDAGADINILDSSGHSAFSGAFDNKEENLGKLVYSTVELLVMHVEQMLFCGVHVSRVNMRITKKMCNNFRIKQSIHQKFQEDYEKISSVEIGLDSWTLGDFLPEQGILSQYHSMLERDWNQIDTFFMSNDWYSYRKSNEVSKFILLQYRKANRRIQVYRCTDSITVFARVPSHVVFSDKY